VKLLVAFAAQFSPRASEIRVDGVVLATGFATSIAAALALAFMPRIGDGRSLAASLVPTAGGRRITLGRGRQRLQHWLVVTQIAVCMVLLTGAGLLVRTLSKLDAVSTGVRVDHVLTMELPLGGDILREIFRQPQNLARYEEIRDRVAALPGVTVAAVGSNAPLRNAMMEMNVRADGRPQSPSEPTPHAALKTVDPRFFAASGIPLLAGRAFLPTDGRGTERVAIVNESFARSLFGNRDPIGQRIGFTGAMVKLTPFGEDWRTVVGVVGDTRDRGLDNDPVPSFYMPFSQEVIINAALVVRTSIDPALLQPQVVKTVRALYPRQMIEHVATLDQIRDESVAPRRLNALFIAAFGALAFVIAMVGIAGVLAFSVSSRTAEIGIRMSLGADARRVRTMILGEGGALLVAGVAIGFVGAYFAARLLRTLLFGITPHDPATLGVVALGLAAVGVAACWLPAARAARVDPAVALRAE
jgi:predicted permease